MSELYGYTGKLLRVNLTKEQITEELIDTETARKFIGGTGLGVKYLYEEVPPGVEWSDAKNRLIMMSGPLAGTKVSGSGTFSVVTKGCLTNGATASQANGFFGAFLRFSGFDGVIIEGTAKRWVYLHIFDGKAELKDASHLLGKDTWETGQLIQEELGKTQHEISVFGIGPAGENLVKFAGIFGDKGHTAPHNGSGAVMGSKKLKAVAVERGKAAIKLANPDKLSAIARQLHENIVNDPEARENVYRWGTLGGIMRGTGSYIPVKNYTTNVFEISKEDFEKFSPQYIRSHFQPKPHPCWACRLHHCHIFTIPDGPYAGFVGEEPEYEQFAAFGPAIGQTDVAAVVVIANEVDRLGMDTNEMGWVLGLVMECYEKGILTKKDTGGLEMTWGNVAAVRALMRKIAHREGIGDILAEGVMRAAKRIGGEAPKMAIHTMKGSTPRGHDHRVRTTEQFDTSVSDSSTLEATNMIAHPADFKVPHPLNFYSPEHVSTTEANLKGSMQFEDSLGTCRFTTRTDIKLLAEAVNAATGWNLDMAEAMQSGRRAIALLRSFNIRHGHTRADDRPSPRYGSTPVDGIAKGKTLADQWDTMLDNYYRLMGWDEKTGKPLPDTLKSLGLESVITDLWGKK
ncbi:MAG: aldehyde ferredoxin oxidoreductase C-terminal domain-containing protein [Chloroflexota bacterium]